MSKKCKRRIEYYALLYTHGVITPREEAVLCRMLKALVVHTASKYNMLKEHGTLTEPEELVSEGMVAAFECVQQFKPKSGMTFSTFAVPRIRGRMVDYLRKVSPVTRNERRIIAVALKHYKRAGAVKWREAAREELTSKEIAKADRLFFAQIPVSIFDTMNVVNAKRPDDRQLVDVLIGDLPRNGTFTRAELLSMIHTAIDDVRVRIAMVEFYIQERKLYEIAEAMGITAARVSQLRKQGEETLRLLIDKEQQRALQ